MFTRNTVAVALISSAAIAQMPIKKMEVGNDVNGDGTIDVIAASCSGGFADENAEGTFFVGYGIAEGSEDGMLMIRGENLCVNDAVDFDTEYTTSISLDLGNTWIDTPYKLLCDKKGMKEMQKNFETLVNDKALMKSIKDSKKLMQKGELIVVDPVMSNSGDAATGTVSLVDEQITDAKNDLATRKSEVEASMDTYLTKVDEMSGDVDEKINKRKDKYETDVAKVKSKLNEETQVAIAADSEATAKLDAITDKMET